MPKGGPSHLAAVVRLAVAGARRRGRSQLRRPAEPARKLAVERRGIGAEVAQLSRYLAATRGSAVYPLAGDDAVLPPTYSAVWETALTLELLAMEGMPFPGRGIVHVASELVVVRPLRLGEQVRCRLALERAEAHPRGTLLVLDSRCWNEAGQLCQQNETEILVRGAVAPAGAQRMPQTAASGGATNGEGWRWREVATWPLPADAGVRYARASGDFNPIHLWPWSSRLLGYSRPILHGHCTLAMIAHELSTVTGRQTRKIAARFRAPVELPGRVRLEAAEEPESSALALRVVSSEGTGKPYAEGRWVGEAGCGVNG
jgi:acyl dehydratase